MVSSTVLAATLVTALGATGFMANEASHGQMAEAMDFGHHHMMDDAERHCPMMQNGTMDRSQCASMMEDGGMMGGMHQLSGVE